MSKEVDLDLIRSLPVDGPFDEDDLRLLAATDLDALSDAMHRAPVDGPFTPGQALELSRCANLEAALAAADVECAREQGPIDPSTFVGLSK